MHLLEVSFHSINLPVVEGVAVGLHRLLKTELPEPESWVSPRAPLLPVLTSTFPAFLLPPSRKPQD